MSFTVFGATGFLGSHLVAGLRRQGVECRTPGRNDHSVYTNDLGHVVYCVGLTADFRERPLDTARAHVCALLDVLEKGRFHSFLYLSSTRVYGGLERGEEDAVFRVDPRSTSDVYNLSKLMGESLCFALGRPQVRVVRLSNVYGEDWSSSNFLTAVIRAAIDEGRVELRTPFDSAKDYVGVDDVVKILLQVAVKGRRQLYNVASGVNVSNRDLLAVLQRLTGCGVTGGSPEPAVVFPPISISRAQEEFDFAPASVLESLPALVSSYRAKRDRRD